MKRKVEKLCLVLFLEFLEGHKIIFISDFI